MISNICAFLSCCFAITSNIKTIESAGGCKTVPVRFFAQTSNADYVRTVNSLITFSKNPISMKPAEQTILSTAAWETYEDYKLKLKSRDKLEKKAKDIKCSFCVIAKSNILHLVEKLKSQEPFVNDEEPLTDLKEEAELVLHLLLLANLETGKWLWSYYLKILAIGRYDDMDTFIRENPFGDVQLQTDVSKFIDGCIEDKYLPIAAKEYDLVSKKPNVYNDMFCVLRNSRTFINTRVLSRRAPMVTVEFLYLKRFWHDEYQVLFGQITEVNVDWSRPKQRHQVEVAKTREFLDSRTWMHEPYGRLDHQHLLVKILDARFYCYISVVLHIYGIQLALIDEQTLTDIRDFIYTVMHYTLELTAFKDEFLVAIVSEFNYVDIREIDDIKDMSARVKTKANEILNDLNGVRANTIDRFSFNVDEAQLSTDDYLMRIVQKYEDYLLELKGVCFPFGYDVLLHFMDVVKMSAAQYI
ncbi:uncharacterized protein LOC126837069 [Adelges cooleyi]|uniref:uncharacterized protein LOC126837069 n=1 Tax=Adelges cooleyi TaxID=133065 RepID=UPI00217F92CA|nr:uncharacterized protein LOC126837069 [Adelges cooleyi]